MMNARGVLDSYLNLINVLIFYDQRDDVYFSRDECQSLSLNHLKAVSYLFVLNI